MRYLGNKDTIVEQIKSFFFEKNLANKNLVLFDAFCGTGSVSSYLKDSFKIIINDNLKWAVSYTEGKILSSDVSFSNLGFDPIKYLNDSKDVRHNFIFNNYSPAKSKRMYFTENNAGRIDYFREQIEQWLNDKKINKKEYNYLIFCLINAVSDVSNTAGVYGAFLKKWDSRALKEIELYHSKDKVNYNDDIIAYCDKLENIIDKVECDVLYLDPPYTQNQYGTQYHLLETLILNDNPEISEITGSRPTGPMRSDWSKEYKVNILLDKILAKTKAKYIMLSYSNDGLMSKEFIEACFKRYGKAETYVCKKINYKKYQNWKSANEDEHFEYLFFIEKKENITYESPLNYTGSKYKIINDINQNLPKNIDKFIDVFGGGFNVGINSFSKKIIYNDINYFVEELIKSFKEIDTYEYIKKIKRYISKFKLEKGNKDNYITARNYYNSQPIEKRDSILLFTLIMYGFQQQIRFNSAHEFNNPVGVRWFNEKILEKFISFSREIKEKNVEFYSKNYEELLDLNSKNDFIYLDPPYMLTTGSYNDGKRGFFGWNCELELQLLKKLSELDKKNIKFMLSYVVEHKGKKNERLLSWIQECNFKLINLDEIRGVSGSIRKEVLITNYEIL